MAILLLALLVINVSISFHNHLKLKKIMSAQDQINTVIQELNDATTAISTKLSSIIAAEGDNVSSDSLTQLQGIADQLKALGSDPANPIPAASGAQPSPSDQAPIDASASAASSAQAS